MKTYKQTYQIEIDNDNQMCYVRFLDTKVERSEPFYDDLMVFDFDYVQNVVSIEIISLERFESLYGRQDSPIKKEIPYILPSLLMARMRATDRSHSY